MIASETRGHGPSVVLAHGMGVTRHMWQAQVDALGDRFRLIAYDARGHGDSPAGDPGNTVISVPQAVQDLIDAADAHGAERFALVGASMGARTVIETTLAHPDRVTALVISDITDQSGPEAQQRLAHAARVLESATDGGRAMLSAGPGAASYIRHEQQHGRTPFAGHDRLALASTLRTLSAGRPALADLAGELGSIRCPVLVLHGADDAPSRAASQVVSRLLTAAQLVEIPDAGHLAALDAPASYTRVLEEFLLHATPPTIAVAHGTELTEGRH